MRTRVIWKYLLPTSGEGVLTMPRGSTVLTVQAQTAGALAPNLSLWAVVDPGATRVDRRFYVAQTGETVPASANLYLGTVQINWYVAHVYEVRT